MSTLLPTVAAAAPLVSGWAAHSLWMRRQLARARRCPLTGLPTRAEFTRRASRLLARTDGAVILIDLDGFKAVNDIYGHAAGDAVIRAAGVHLSGWATVHGAVVGRLGGDEFAAAMPVAYEGELKWTLRSLHWRLCQPVSTEDTMRVSVGASLGGVPTTSGTSLASALRVADEAMYQVKQTGGGYLIATGLDPVYRTVAGRRDGRPGTSEAGEER